MGLFGIIASVVGVVGIGGVIAFAVLAPAAAIAFYRGLVAIVASIWDTRAGCAVMVGLACFMAGAIAGDNYGESRIQNNWDAANAVAAEKARKADANIAKQAEQLDAQASDEEAKADEEAAEERNAYVLDLEKRAAGVCALGDADIERMR